MAIFFRSIRLSLLAVAVVGAAGVALADQKIKTKSNIKNDRMAESAASAASAGAAPLAQDVKAKAAAKAKQP